MRPPVDPASLPTRLGDDGVLPAPSRGDVSAVRVAAAEGGGDAEVWERLAARGHIPVSWVAHERRAFSAWCHDCKGLGFATRDGRPLICATCEGATQIVRPQPAAGLAWCVACDVAGVERAEALADELCARLVDRGVRPRGPGLYWRIAAPPITVATRRWRDLRGPFPPFGPYGRIGLADAVADDLRARDEDTAAVLSPLAAIYALGYAVDTMLSSGVVLVAPAG